MISHCFLHIDVVCQRLCFHHLRLDFILVHDQRMNSKSHINQAQSSTFSALDNLPGPAASTSKEQQALFLSATRMVKICSEYHWLVVSTPLKNISQDGNLPQVGVKIDNI